MSKEIENKHLLVGSAIAISIAVISLWSGYAILLFGAWGVGAGTILMLLGSSGDLSIWHKVIMPVGTVLIVLLTVGAFVSMVRTTPIETRYYDIYHVTAPFGVIWVEQTGEISGSFLAFHGTLNSQLSNSYVAKYMVGDELRTAITTQPLVIDGTFKLEQRIITIRYRSSLFTHTGWDKDSITEWIIHLPSLPSTNQTEGDYHIVP